MSGRGKVVNGCNLHDVKEGDLVTIPPNRNHWMIPEKGECLEGFLWYHKKALHVES